mgnify:CR=1 FL=1
MGGAAVSRQIYQDITYSNCSYVCSLLRPEIMRGLELPKYGLQIIPYEGGATMMANGDHYAAYRNPDAKRREMARHSKRDAEAYTRWLASTGRLPGARLSLPKVSAPASPTAERRFSPTTNASTGSGRGAPQPGGSASPAPPAALPASPAAGPAWGWP